MATTSPDNIWTPDSGDDYALTTDLAAMADTIQDTFTGLRASGATRLIDVYSNIPAAGVEGRTFYATDTNRTWFDDGSNWISNDGGSYLIRPTSVVNATIAADGSVNFTAGSSSVGINGVFTDRFRTYLLIYEFGITSGGAGLNFRFRNAGTDDAAAGYVFQTFYSANGVGQAINGSGTLIPLLQPGPASGVGDAKIFSPRVNGVKGVLANAGMTSGAGYAVGMTSGGRSSATAYDGFSIFPSTNSFSNGYLKVYGLA